MTFQQISSKRNLCVVFIFYFYFIPLILCVCPYRQFGAGCSRTCYCIANSTCNEFGNNCFDCEPMYFGSSCENGRTRLSTPPTIVNNNCGEVTIAWKAFNASTDFGVPPSSFNIFCRASNDSGSNPILCGSVNDDGNTTFYFTVTSLIPTLQYSFAILPLIAHYSRNKIDYNDSGLISNYSQWTLPCTAPTVIVPTTTSGPGTSTTPSIITASPSTASITNLTTVTSSSSTIATSLLTVLTSSQPITSGLTSTIGPPTTTANPTTVADRSTVTNTPTTTALVLSPPELVNITAINTTTIFIQWKAGNFNPADGNYSYRIEYLNTTTNSVLYSQVPVTIVSTILNNLSQKTTYRIRIQVKYQDTFGPWSSSVNVTTLSSNDEVINIRDETISAMKNQSLQIAWQAPNATEKPILRYEVTVERIISLLTSETTPFTPRKLTVAQRSISLSDLPAASQFAITIIGVYNDSSLTASQTSYIWTISLSFKAGDVPDIQIQSSDSTSISVNLQPVTKYTGGPLTDYVILYYKTSGATTRQRRGIVSPGAMGFPSDSVVVFNGSQLPLNTLVIGNGNQLSPGYANPPLSASTVYSIVFIAGSTVNGSTVMGGSNPVSTSTAAPAALNGGIIAAIVIAILLFIVLLLLLIWWLWRRKRRQGYAEQKNLAKQERLDYNHSDKLGMPKNLLVDAHENPRFFTNWSFAEDVYGPRYLILDPKYGPPDLRVDLFLSSLNRKGVSFEEEFKSLPKGMHQQHDAAKSRENIRKNYQATKWHIPYDHTRVQLRRSPNSRQSDYINASYIDSYCRRRAYIVAQSPFDEITMEDFWYMIYQENVAQLVMLCECKENGLLTSAMYWPKFHGEEDDMEEEDSVNKSMKWFGRMLVTIEKEDVYARFTVRHFSVAMAVTTGNLSSTSMDSNPSISARQSVIQYHFHDWPPGDSNAVPQSPLPFIEMHTKICVGKQIQDGPVVVHGPLDGSRSGIFVAFDSLLQQGVRENCVNVYKYCNLMHKQRPNLITSATHYMFLYDLLGEALLVSHNLVNLNVRDYYRLVTPINPRTQQTFLQEQHCILEKYTPTGQPLVKNHEDLSSSQKGRVRFPSNVPADEYRVKLSSGRYMNALFLDGFQQVDDYILTDTPMASTVNDFWDMVVENYVAVIVDMQPACYGIEGAIAYWPTGVNEEQRVFGEHVVQVKKVEKVLDDRVLIRHLRVKRGNSDSRGHSVKQYQFLDNWELYDKIPESRVGLVQLITHVLNERRRGPILVHCLDGATRSGLFLLAHLSAIKMFYDHFVDLFHTVKAMKIRRSQILIYQEQYKFLFRFVWDWVRTNMRNELQQELQSQHLAAHLPHEILESSYTYAKAPVTHQHDDDRLNALSLTGDLISMGPETVTDEMRPTLLDFVHYAYYDEIIQKSESKV